MRIRHRLLSILSIYVTVAYTFYLFYLILSIYFIVYVTLFIKISKNKIFHRHKIAYHVMLTYKVRTRHIMRLGNQKITQGRSTVICKMAA